MYGMDVIEYKGNMTVGLHCGITVEDGAENAVVHSTHGGDEGVGSA